MTQFDDLDDDCLLLLLDWLSLEELLTMLLVNQRLHQVAAEKMRTKVKAISLSVSNRLLSKCSHHAISQNQVLNLNKLFENDFLYHCGVHDPPKETIFLSMLSICTSIKCLDFDNFKLTGDFLVEVFQRCPQLECIKLGTSVIQEEDDLKTLWQALDQIGHRIVHFVKECYSNKYPDVLLLKAVALKCANIRHVELKIVELTSEWIAVVKMLPKNCWIKFTCCSFDDGFEDVVDELNITIMEWSNLKQRLEGLSSLKLAKLVKSQNQVHGVDFAGLKKLDISNCLRYDNQFVNCLVESRFPQLEEFSFNACRGFTEDNFDRLFQRMPLLKKLNVLFYKWAQIETFELPQSSIRRLKKLEIMTFKMKSLPSDSEQIQVLQQFEWYVDSIKKLLVETDYHSHHEDKWQSFRDGIEQLKQRQSRDKIEFRI